MHPELWAYLVSLCSYHTLGNLYFALTFSIGSVLPLDQTLNFRETIAFSC